jgi:hypothetical protein
MVEIIISPCMCPSHSTAKHRYARKLRLSAFALQSQCQLSGQAFPRTRKFFRASKRAGCQSICTSINSSRVIHSGSPPRRFSRSAGSASVLDGGSSNGDQLGLTCLESSKNSLPPPSQPGVNKLVEPQSLTNNSSPTEILLLTESFERPHLRIREVQRHSSLLGHRLPPIRVHPKD